MRILQIVPRLPYPLTDGGKVGIFNITKHLALRGHKVTMLTFDQDRQQDIEPLHEICNVIPIHVKTDDSIVSGVLNLFSNVPYKISKYRSSKYQNALLKVLKSENYDVVHVDHLHMAYYGIMCKRIAKLPIVLREHNVESTIVERFVQIVKTPIFRSYLNAQLRRMRHYEAEQTAMFDMCCMITEEDRRRLYALNQSVRTCVIPGGIEASYFSNITSTAKIPHSICFFGSFAWIANRDGVEWFLDEIFPKILEWLPDVQFFLLGKDIPSKIGHLQKKNVFIRGFVPNLKEELSRYEISIAPIRIGGGIRLKILESFAMQIPVVTTSIGCEGIQAMDSKHLLTGDTSDEFAKQVVRLLGDKELRNRIIRNAYVLADEKYRWERIAEQFEDMYKEVISKKRHSSESEGSIDSENSKCTPTSVI
jgi:glycosyltransferase involved in cell wall biosynthesis